MRDKAKLFRKLMYLFLFLAVLGIVVELAKYDTPMSGGCLVIFLLSGFAVLCYRISSAIESSEDNTKN